MFKGYEDWAMKIIEKSKHEKPESDRDAERLFTAFGIMAGTKGAEMLMDGEMGRYDGEDEYYNGRGGRGGRGGFTGGRGGRTGRGGSRMGGSSRGGRGSRYDGMDDGMGMYAEGQRMYYDFDEDEEDEYYNGGSSGSSGSRGGQSGGGRSGGRSGGGGSSGGRRGGMRD